MSALLGKYRIYEKEKPLTAKCSRPLSQKVFVELRTPSSNLDGSSLSSSPLLSSNSHEPTTNSVCRIYSRTDDMPCIGTRVGA